MTTSRQKLPPLPRAVRPPSIPCAWQSIGYATIAGWWRLGRAPVRGAPEPLFWIARAESVYLRACRRCGCVSGYAEWRDESPDPEVTLGRWVRVLLVGVDVSSLTPVHALPSCVPVTRDPALEAQRTPPPEPRPAPQPGPDEDDDDNAIDANGCDATRAA